MIGRVIMKKIVISVYIVVIIFVTVLAMTKTKESWAVWKPLRDIWAIL